MNQNWKPETPDLEGNEENKRRVRKPAPNQWEPPCRPLPLPQLEHTHLGGCSYVIKALATSLGQERMFLSFLNTSHWLCPFVVTILESGHDKDWNWHTSNSACPGAGLDRSVTVSSSSITPGRSVPAPMTPVRNFQVSAHFFITIACPAWTRKGWHLGWGRNGQCLLLSASCKCQFGFSLNISKFWPSRLVI